MLIEVGVRAAWHDPFDQWSLVGKLVPNGTKAGVMSIFWFSVSFTKRVSVTSFCSLLDNCLVI